jgi:uncharacterized FlaG/YvyC family protein
MLDKKYQFTGNKKNSDGQVLHEIIACREFAGVKVGALGGYIASTSSLSHYGNCWVDVDAEVKDGAVVDGNAVISGSSRLKGRAVATGSAKVISSMMSGESMVSGGAVIKSTSLRGDADVRLGSTVSASTIDGKTVLKNCNIRGSYLCFSDSLESVDVFGGTMVIKPLIILQAENKIVVTDNTVNINGNVRIIEEWKNEHLSNGVLRDSWPQIKELAISHQRHASLRQERLNKKKESSKKKAVKAEQKDALAVSLKKMEKSMKELKSNFNESINKAALLKAEFVSMRDSRDDVLIKIGKLEVLLSE